MRIVYFASLRRQVGMAEESVTPPAGTADVATLVAWLKERSPAHRAAFEGCSRLMVAVNQDYADFDRAVGPEDEIAFFPPVTGG